MRRIVSGVVALVVTQGIDGVLARADEGLPWHGDGISDGVQVEHRAVAGSHFDELRLSMVTTLSVARICDAIYPKVFPTKLERRFKKQELLRETANERWTYEQISVPVVSDRDYVVHVKLEVPASTGQCAVSFVSEDDPTRPPPPGFVRIPAIRGHWDVFPLEGGKVSVQIQNLQRARRRCASIPVAWKPAQHGDRVHEAHPVPRGRAGLRCALSRAPARLPGR